MACSWLPTWNKGKRSKKNKPLNVEEGFVWSVVCIWNLPPVWFSKANWSCVSDETKCDSQDDDNSNKSCYLNCIKVTRTPTHFSHVLRKKFPQKYIMFVVRLCYTSITENSEFQIVFSQHVQCVTDLKVRDVAAVTDK